MELLLREKTEELSTIKEIHSDEVSRVMQEMRQLRVNYEEKIKEYEDLLDLRVKLEQEIATLSVLLQEEESRFNYINLFLKNWKFPMYFFFSKAEYFFHPHT